MSTHASDDLDQMDYFLPEDSQQRLKRLCENLRFLVQLAQPRTRDEELEREPDVYMGDVAMCLELLGEQADLVLDALSWRQAPGSLREEDDDDGASEAAADVEEENDTADERFAFGLTVTQVDALDRLARTISAHGDVVTTGRTAELAEGTLVQLGQAIFDAADGVQSILDQVETQRLEQGARSPGRVGEERGAYAVGLAVSAVGSRLIPVPSLAAYGMSDRFVQADAGHIH